MSAIAEVFERCRREKRAAFIPFLTAGDPDLETTAALMQAMADGGADLIELGVPFSDPIADGPVIQRASTRALASGTTLSGILRLVARHRDRLGVPILLFSYFNPIHARGVESFAEQAAASGVDGLLCVDLPPDEGAHQELIPVMRRYGLDTVFLLAPTSTRERFKRVAQYSTGFVYYVTRTGITGDQGELPKELVRETRKLRRKLSQPLAVGFGITTPEQAASLGRVADGVVVGSALVKLIEEKTGDDDLLEAVEQRVRELSEGLRR
ncbi:MAG: tryptophan synthase subunit alpha [Acidobacteriota bacterium]